MKKNKNKKVVKLTSPLHEALDELELWKLDAQQSALSPDKPNLSPNEIDCLKAVLGF